MTLAERLKTLRAQKKFTQERLAAESGVSKTTIVNIENDNGISPTLDTLTFIADALGVKVEALVKS